MKLNVWFKRREILEISLFYLGMICYNVDCVRLENRDEYFR